MYLNFMEITSSNHKWNLCLAFDVKVESFDNIVIREEVFLWERGERVNCYLLQSYRERWELSGLTLRLCHTFVAL